MIATGNHGDFDSLRVAPRPYRTAFPYGEGGTACRDGRGGAMTDNLSRPLWGHPPHRGGQDRRRAIDNRPYRTAFPYGAGRGASCNSVKKTSTNGVSG